MVKFAKELLSQRVPEWQDAYCNYDELKEDLRRIQQHRLLGPTYTRTGSLGLLRSLVSMKADLSKTLTRTLTRRGRPEYMASLSSKPGQHSKDTLVVGFTAAHSLHLLGHFTERLFSIPNAFHTASKLQFAGAAAMPHMLIS